MSKPKHTLLFQTLIGILQTPTKCKGFFQNRRVSNPYRYSTNKIADLGTKADTWKFQTLIGILQTNTCPVPHVSLDTVSNPYRYSTNSIVFGSI